MESGITLEHVVTVGGFLVSIVMAALGIWKYVESKVEAVRKEAAQDIEAARKDAAQASSTAQATASLAREELASHRLHVAEHYVSKEGHRGATAMIMKSIEAVSDKLDHLTGRIDGLMKPTTRSRSS